MPKSQVSLAAAPPPLCPPELSLAPLWQVNGSAWLIFTAVINATSIFRGRQQLQKHVTVFSEQWHTGRLRPEQHCVRGATASTGSQRGRGHTTSHFAADRIFFYAEQSRGGRSAPPCEGSSGTLARETPPSVASQLEARVASTECMLTVVPGDWSGVGHMRGARHSFTRGQRSFQLNQTGKHKG